MARVVFLIAAVVLFILAPHPEGAAEAARAQQIVAFLLPGIVAVVEELPVAAVEDGVHPEQFTRVHFFSRPVLVLATPEIRQLRPEQVVAEVVVAQALQIRLLVAHLPEAPEARAERVERQVIPATRAGQEMQEARQAQPTLIV